MGLLRLALLIITFFLILATAIFLFYSFLSNFFGAPYLPSNKKRSKIMIEFANLRKGEKVVDLGSGDGRLVVNLAGNGVLVYGFEINPILVLVSRVVILLYGLSGTAFIYFQNFWDANLSSYSLIIVYGLPSMMSRLEKKLKKELKPGTRIISNAFKFPTLKLIKQKGGVYLYQI